jgi:hypothetical protein
VSLNALRTMPYSFLACIWAVCFIGGLYWPHAHAVGGTARNDPQLGHTLAPCTGSSSTETGTLLDLYQEWGGTAIPSQGPPPPATASIFWCYADLI